MLKPHVLLVDDDVSVRFVIRDFLESHGYLIEEAGTIAEAFEKLQAGHFDAGVVDYMLPDGNSMDLLAHLKGAALAVPLIVLTAHASIDLAVHAVKEGAEHFLTKPVALPALHATLERLLENQRARRNDLAGQRASKLDPFLGTSAAIRRLGDEAHRLLEGESPILIQGETGTGKGVLARWMHQSGPRQREAFVDLNCAGLSREFVETELFGHERGAFTGARGPKLGLLEVAHRGHVFLDEIGDLDPQVQPKLLKVLEEKRFRRLGDVRDRVVDVRLIAATHRDLRGLVRDGRFRGDLYFRISTLPLVIPPLRERLEDLPLLVERVLAGLSASMHPVGAVTLAPDAAQALREYAWPGNLRELRNVLERAVMLSRQPLLRRQDLRFDAGLEPTRQASADEGLTLEEVELRHIERVLESESGHVGRAAERLGIPRSSLYQKLKKRGLRES